MKDKKRVICINDLVDGLNKDDVYEVEKELNVYGIIYYTVKDKYGVFNDFLADRFVDTKQVVIIGKESCYNILSSPYWIIEYYKRKNIKLFIYNWRVDLECNIYYNLINPNYCDFNNEDGFVYSLKNLGNKVFNNDVAKTHMKFGYDFLQEVSREDSDLIEIVKSMNNDNSLKVVDIPINVEYTIEEYNCNNGEYISEKHRTWS